MAEVRLERIRKVFGRTVAADDVDLVVADGEFVVLVGPSGCGKTTLLRCLAGLEQVDGGAIYIGGRDATPLPPRARRIAMVFQSYALFPHMTVRDNVAFGLRMRHQPRPAVDARVASIVELVGIPHLLDRYPSQLSGGQRQRVAVARALATEADVLLMDEPLSNLDALLRMQMRAELKALLQRLGTTTVYVTHDQVEALSMGDRVAVMRAGRIVQIDSPLGVYDNPADTYVGGFIGMPPMNFLPAEVVAAGTERRVRLSGGPIRLPAAQLPGETARPLVLGIRAESIEIELSPADDLLPASVVVTEPLGSHNLLTVRSGTDLLKVSARADLFLLRDRDVWLRLDPRKIRWMDRETGAALRPAAHGEGRSLVEA
jgi:multiple sugar transport system ATP-binding protein